jgi:hypothetical protein
VEKFNNQKKMKTSHCELKWTEKPTPSLQWYQIYNNSIEITSASNITQMDAAIASARTVNSKNALASHIMANQLQGVISLNEEKVPVLVHSVRYDSHHNVIIGIQGTSINAKSVEIEVTLEWPRSWPCLDPTPTNLLR